MKPLKFFSPIVLIVFSIVSCFAQQGAATVPEAPNFSGRWLSKAIREEPGYVQVLPRDFLNLKVELLITHSGDELKVKETTLGSSTYSREVVYYLDGRGETNKGFTDGFVYESKTMLKKQRLNVQLTIRPSGAPKSVQTQEWELSKDRKTLTIKTRSGVIRYERVFRLVP